MLRYIVSAPYLSGYRYVMDRSEAYHLLTEEMNKLTRLSPDQLTPLCERTLEIDRQGSSGTLYRVELDLEHLASGRFIISGRVHDNSGYRFSLLKERMEFEVGKNE